MIKYLLQCADAHEFEAWFASSAHYEVQASAGGVSCPHCGSTQVSKAIMSPHVGRGTATKADAREIADRGPLEQARQLALVRRLRQALLASSEDVGAGFADEARKIHYGETDPRAIRGKASVPEARGLVEEGIDVFALPPLPEETN